MKFSTEWYIVAWNFVWWLEENFFRKIVIGWCSHRKALQNTDSFYDNSSKAQRIIHVFFSRRKYWWHQIIQKVSYQSDSPFESYFANGQKGTLIDSIVYELFEYTKKKLSKINQIFKNKEEWSKKNWTIIFDDFIGHRLPMHRFRSIHL